MVSRWFRCGFAVVCCGFAAVSLRFRCGFAAVSCGFAVVSLRFRCGFVRFRYGFALVLLRFRYGFKAIGVFVTIVVAHRKSMISEKNSKKCSNFLSFSDVFCLVASVLKPDKVSGSVVYCTAICGPARRTSLWQI